MTKRHLRARDWRHRRRSACGLTDPKFTSINPADVDCERCRRTPQMADAEIAAAKKRKRD